MEKIALFDIEEELKSHHRKYSSNNSDSEESTPQTRRVKQSIRVAQDKVMSNVQIFKEDFFMVCSIFSI